jgi:D-alanyl-D-alanine endopeptidase (penicillin-binding protein 7)
MLKLVKKFLFCSVLFFGVAFCAHAQVDNVASSSLEIAASTSSQVLEGKATWYNYKPGLFAAAVDFPLGSKLKVINKANGKSVEVVVNDYGPNRVKYPERVIDLEKAAFALIADLGQGIINVKVSLADNSPVASGTPEKEVFQVASTSNSANSTTNKTAISAKSFFVMNEKTGEVLFAKNSRETLSIASLTKLIAMKVFLDRKIKLTKKITYKTADENYNYQYVDKSESGSLKVKEGDTLTVKDALYAALVGSANNMVETLVRVSGLTRNNFIKKMNDTAKKFGATQTKFIEPTGLSPENVSSARDYAIITKKAIAAQPLIKTISSAAVYKLSLSNRKKVFSIKNPNHLFSDKTLPIIGSKTGYLNESGYCLMTRVKNKKGEAIVAVTLGATSKNNSFESMKKLLMETLKL